MSRIVGLIVLLTFAGNAGAEVLGPGYFRTVLALGIANARNAGEINALIREKARLSPHDVTGRKKIDDKIAQLKGQGAAYGAAGAANAKGVAATSDGGMGMLMMGLMAGGGLGVAGGLAMSSGSSPGGSSTYVPPVAVAPAPAPAAPFPAPIVVQAPLAAAVPTSAYGAAAAAAERAKESSYLSTLKGIESPARF